MIDVIFLIIIAAFVISGAKRGFAKSIVGLLSTGVSIVLSAFLLYPIAELLKSVGIGKSVETSAAKWIENSTQNNAVVPSFLTESLNKTAVTALTELVVNAISFLIVIILVRILIGILAGAIGFIMKLPVLKQANALLGGVFAGLCGIVVCYIAVGIIAALAPAGIWPKLTEMLNDSILLSGWYNNNLLAGIFVEF